MRIIGEINHPIYKISVLKMNEKVTIQIEDRLVTQSFAFRDGSGIRDLESAEKLLTPDFMTKVDKRFNDMHTDYMNTLQSIHEDEVDDFEII